MGRCSTRSVLAVAVNGWFFSIDAQHTKPPSALTSPSTWALTHSIPSPQSLWWPFQKVVVYLKRESSGSLFKWYHLTQGQAPGGHFQTAIDYLSDTQSIDQQTFSFFFFFFFFYNVLIKLPLSGQIQPNQKSTSKLLCAHMMLVSATMD